MVRNTSPVASLLASLLLLPSLAACSSDDSGKAPSASPSTDGGGSEQAPAYDFSKYDEAVNTFLAENGLEGASGVIVHKKWGVLHTAGYGAFAPDRKYLVASSSKIVSVGILMRLVDQGKLDIDAPIGSVLSAAWGTNAKSDLEVAQLVSNSSGLVSLTDNPLYGPYLCQYVDGSDLATCAQSIYQTTADAPDRKPPDTEFHYGGGQWQLAGGVAQVASNETWADLVTETYVDGCGATTFGYGNQFTQAFSSGGAPDGGGSLADALAYPPFFQGDPANLHPTTNPSIEGGLYTTAGDYGKVLLMHLRGGLCDGKRVLSEQAVARMQEDRIGEKYQGKTPSPDLEGYGLGWWIDRNHPGVFADPGAYGAVPWLDLSRDYAAFLVIEKDAGVGAQLFTMVKPVLDDVFDSTN
ncbi:MAG TPA: serine hydrolase [Polyangiaceae bacterium]|nr:serine hydrolase [Polyangiaceae bacterium]